MQDFDSLFRETLPEYYMEDDVIYYSGSWYKLVVRPSSGIMANKVMTLPYINMYQEKSGPVGILAIRQCTFPEDLVISKFHPNDTPISYIQELPRQANNESDFYGILSLGPTHGKRMEATGLYLCNDWKETTRPDGLIHIYYCTVAFRTEGP